MRLCGELISGICSLASAMAVSLARMVVTFLFEAVPRILRFEPFPPLHRLATLGPNAAYRAPEPGPEATYRNFGAPRNI